MSYWGYKFETLCCLPDTWHNTSREYIENRDKLPTSNAAQHCTIAQISIGQTPIVIGGEVDAIWDARSESDQTQNWVEFKTALDPTLTRNAPKNYSKKLLRTWMQCYLVNAKKIVMGLRNHDGVLKRIEEFDLMQLAADRREMGDWDVGTGIKYVEHFLEFLNDAIPDGEGVYKIARKRGSGLVTVERMSEMGYGRILTPEFIEHRSLLVPNYKEPVVKSPASLHANIPAERRSQSSGRSLDSGHRWPTTPTAVPSPAENGNQREESWQPISPVATNTQVPTRGWGGFQLEPETAAVTPVEPSVGRKPAWGAYTIPVEKRPGSNWGRSS